MSLRVLRIIGWGLLIFQICGILGHCFFPATDAVKLRAYFAQSPIRVSLYVLFYGLPAALAWLIGATGTMRGDRRSKPLARSAAIVFVVVAITRLSS